MKRTIMIVLTLFTLWFINVPVCWGEKVNLKKVNEYIDQLEMLLEKYPDTSSYVEGTPQLEKKNKIRKTCHLNESEFLETLNILIKDEDITNMAMIGSMERPFDQRMYNRSLIFSSTAGDLMKKWTKEQSTVENILIKKILPIISTTKNQAILRYWIDESASLFRKIDTMNDENRNKFCDKLVEIFMDKKNPINIRIRAIIAWTAGEERNDKMTQYFSQIAGDEVLFEATAFYFYHGLRTPRAIMEKMFDILRNDDKYHHNIVMSALDFLGRIAVSNKVVLRNRLKRVLFSKIKQEKDNKDMKDLVERYKGIVNAIRWMENRERRENKAR